MYRGTGGRIGSVDARKSKNAVTSVNERGSSAGRDIGSVGRLGGAAGRGVVPQGISLANSLMKKMNGDGDWLLSVMLFEVFYYGIWQGGWGE